MNTVYQKLKELRRTEKVSQLRDTAFDIYMETMIVVEVNNLDRILEERRNLVKSPRKLGLVKK